MPQPTISFITLWWCRSLILMKHSYFTPSYKEWGRFCHLKTLNDSIWNHILQLFGAWFGDSALKFGCVVFRFGWRSKKGQIWTLIQPETKYSARIQGWRLKQCRNGEWALHKTCVYRKYFLGLLVCWVSFRETRCPASIAKVLLNVALMCFND